LSGSADTWKVTLPCTLDEARVLQEDISSFAELDPPPVLMTSEPDPARPEEWRLDAYFEGEPDKSSIARLRTLVPSAAGVEPAVDRIEQQDWVTLSQQGLEPIRAGRFFVHTPQHRADLPADALTLEIDAGRAFGTGHHETTSGCLEALDRLKASGARFANLIDLGTGTGLLAFAALRLWPAARATASDIDPVAIDVTRENSAINGIQLGRARGQVEAIVADGMDHPRLKARAPYDIIIANILAGPLIEFAPSVAGALGAGGRLILSGLLDSQADAVAAAYRRHGLMLSFRITRGDWPTLVMRKRKALGWR
jgi:ribosomal protein L11 methyltransferase